MPQFWIKQHWFKSGLGHRVEFFVSMVKHRPFSLDQHGEKLRSQIVVSFFMLKSPSVHRSWGYTYSQYSSIYIYTYIYTYIHIYIYPYIHIFHGEVASMFICTSPYLFSLMGFSTQYFPPISWLNHVKNPAFSSGWCPIVN